MTPCPSRKLHPPGEGLLNGVNRERSEGSNGPSAVVRHTNERSCRAGWLDEGCFMKLVRARGLRSLRTNPTSRGSAACYISPNV